MKTTLSEKSIRCIEIIRMEDTAVNMILENCLVATAEKIEDRQAWLKYEKKVKEE
ncbi:hypothetical protein [Halalkalibacter krulwichiae]|uniref:Phage protein n=1 Tax=Halalkalibacter krulwichiae TaxID=199441 RepID=A0A1X9MFL4_9BACI|nr:hypothetical protein [Halalkalibacter krulwichiae]ARK31320.1 hypothetical protein BkAM31D_16470 [Halalkalibacter krulwichiae]